MRVIGTHIRTLEIESLFKIVNVEMAKDLAIYKNYRTVDKVHFGLNPLPDLVHKQTRKMKITVHLCLKPRSVYFPLFGYFSFDRLPQMSIAIKPVNISADGA